MQSIKKLPLLAAAFAPVVAFAHEESGWASIHWHASDFLGLAVVGALSVAALWLARRQKRAARQK